MVRLHPTLWRTCRVIANTTRLRLLWKIFEAEGLCVDELARQTGTSRPNATIQLRALNSRGLIARYQKTRKVIYRAESNPDVEHAEELLQALRICCEKRIHFDVVFRQATAFTHPARIELVRRLYGSKKDFDELLEVSGLSPESLSLHLKKLESRHFVRCRKRVYQLLNPSNPLGACLMRIVCTEDQGCVQIARVISGGQTGADRAALDAAIACGVPHGGWCPKGRLAEDGPIPLKYNLRELDSQEYPVRTKANVDDSDITLIFCRGPLSGGSLLTKQFAEERGKPCVLVDLQAMPEGLCRLEKLAEQVPNPEKITLNVAGPRASSDPEIYSQVYSAVVRLLRSP